MSDGNKKDRGPWKAVRLIVSACLLVYLFYDIGYADVLAVVSQATLWPIVVCMLIIFSRRLLVAYRWYALVRTESADVGFAPLFRIVLVSGSLGFFTPGTVGIELIRVYALARLTDLTLALSSVAVERLTALLALVGFVLVGLLFAPIDMSATIGISLGVMIAGLCLATLSLFAPWLRAFYLALLVGRFLAPLRSRVLQLYEQLDAFRRQPWLMPQMALLSIGLQLQRVLETAALTLALGVEVDIAYLLVIVPLGVVLSLLPISLGGLGLREAVYVALFGAIGVDAASAFTLSFLHFMLVIVVVVVPGAVLYASGGLQTGEQSPR